MKTLECISPAKINLMLAIHGQRGDGFHDLSSLIVSVQFGDRLRVSMSDIESDQLICDDPRVPVDETNLILKAAKIFRQATGVEHGFHFELEKRIPMGAGLGGGSSNASVALKAMNSLACAELSNDTLRSLASKLGSDCAFFIDSGPSLMTGRGETITAKNESIYKKLSGQRVVLFRPDFSVHTGWAYGQLIRAMPSVYTCKETALKCLERFETSNVVGDLLLNTFEPVIGRKYMAIPSLLGLLRENNIDCLMSGSGSCCFALPKNDEEAALVRKICQTGWGSDIFFIETSIG